MSNDKKDASADPKRPHATLDLKATDVTPAEKAAESAAKASAEAAAASASASAGAKTAEPPKATPGPTGAAKPGETKQSDTKSAGAATPKATDKAQPAPVVVRRSGGGIFSHLLAGIAGGVLAFGLADWAAPRLGIATSTQGLQVRTDELQQRVAAVEKTATASDLTQKLQAAEERLASLEGKAETIGTSQRQFADATKASIEKLSSEALSAETERRLTAVDDRLATIAKAAADGGDGKGNIGQLSAVTGKLADLQTSLGKEIDAVRNSVPQNVEPKLATLTEQVEAAKAGTQRTDGDITALKTDAARLSQRIETLKADADRSAAMLKVLQEEAAQMTLGFADVKATVVTQVKGGVGEAMTPVTKKVAALEESLQSVVKSEADRRTNAERIVVSLELANLKRLIDSGQNYASGLADVRRASAGKFDLSALERFKDTGVPTIGSLQRDFRPVANAIVDAAEVTGEGGVFDKLVAGAKSVVRVRNMNPSPSDKSADAVVARMQVALSEGRLGEVLEFAKELPQAASVPAQDWLDNVKARHSVDHAIGEVEKQLKSSLTQAAVEAPPAQAAPAAGAAPAPTPAPADAAASPANERLPAPGSVRPNTSAPSTAPSPTAQP